MQAARRAAQHHPREKYPDEGLHSWVVLVCLALAAVACFLLLRFTINLMGDQPPVQPTTPSTARAFRPLPG